MIREYKTVRDAAELWVSQFDAVYRKMIYRLMKMYEPEDWKEVTAPAPGDIVYVYEIPKKLNTDTSDHYGEIYSYDKESGLYRIEFYTGKVISCTAEDFEVERNGLLPMWDTMWAFSDPCDNQWLEEGDGIPVMSACGFRIYHSEEFGYFFGIDGGYDFYEKYWIPLYRARGLHPHDEPDNTEEE